jgi:hypothetical protein
LLRKGLVLPTLWSLGQATLGKPFELGGIRQKRPALLLAIEGPLLFPQGLVHDQRIQGVARPPHPNRCLFVLLSEVDQLDSIVQQAYSLENTGKDLIPGIPLIGRDETEGVGDILANQGPVKTPQVLPQTILTILFLGRL